MTQETKDCGCIKEALESMKAEERRQLFVEAYQAICQQYGYQLVAITHIQPSASATASENTIVIQLPTQPSLDVVPIVDWQLPVYEGEDAREKAAIAQ